MTHWTYFIPTLKTYEDALRHHDSVKPVRGDAEKRRPLGRRRDKHLHIKKADNGDVVVWDWAYPVVTYKPEGNIEFRNLVMRDSTTAKLISCLLSVGCFIRHNAMWISCTAEVDGEIKSGHLPLQTNPWNERQTAKTVDIFSFVDGRLRCHNPNFPVQHVLNKKKFNEAKKPYRAFYRYLVANAKLRGADGYSLEELQNTFKFDGNPLVPLYQEKEIRAAAKSDDTEQHYLLYLTLANWASVLPTYWNTPTAAQNIRSMKEQFSKFVLYNHHKEVVSKQTVYSMKTTQDAYEWVANLPA